MERERIAMMLIAGGMLAALLLSYATRPPDRTDPEIWARDFSPRSASATMLSADRLAQCRKTIVHATQGGIIRERPSPDRIDVDEALWDELTPDKKGRIMQAIACDVWRAVAPPTDHQVIAYSWTNGRRLAMLSGIYSRR